MITYDVNISGTVHTVTRDVEVMDIEILIGELVILPETWKSETIILCSILVSLQIVTCSLSLQAVETTLRHINVCLNVSHC